MHDDKDDDDCGGGCAGAFQAPLPAERPTALGSAEVRSAIASWILVAGGLVSTAANAPRGVVIGLYACAIVAGAYYFAREAIEELIEEREVGIELLMTIAIVAAAALGQWREASLVAGLFSITEALEGFTIRRTRYAIRDLMARVPPRARVLRDGREVEVPIEDVAVGERVVIRPGENVPTDGVIREGASVIDQGAVTGESMPIERAVGDTVFAGTVNGAAALVVEATRIARDNTVSRIVHLVEEAQAQKAATQQWVERFGRVYSPAVLLIAIGVGVVPAVLGGDVAAWAIRAASFLVAASPCALAVATPVTLVAAIGGGAHRGVLIKGGNVLEGLARVRAVALDKTGTVTVGKPAVTATSAPSLDDAELLRLAAAVEHRSEHPLAKAILRAAEAAAISLPTAEDFTASIGAGASARVDGRLVGIWKPTAAAARGVALEAGAERWIRSAEERGETVVVVEADGTYLGLIAIADTVRPDARQLIDALRGAGIEKIVMLTGDNAQTAKVIADRIGIDEVYAGLLPEDKVVKVKELTARFGAVAMVGDGINDAPALATATVGIAIGTGGSDAAIAAADVALVGADLALLVDAIRLSRRSRSIVRQNVGAALAIVSALIVATFAVDLRMLAAVLTHEGSEILIVLNGLRAALR